MARPVILALARTFLPGFRGGGPVRSLQALANAVRDEFDLRVIAGDRDLGDAAPYPGISPGVWERAGGVPVCYVPSPPGHWGALRRALNGTPHAALYINDFLSPEWGVYPLALRSARLVRRVPTIVAPRGQFASGALRFKRWKKAAYLTAARKSGLLRGIVWHATTAQEADEIRAVAGAGAVVSVVPNLPGLRRTPQPLQPLSADGPLRLLFVSRIAPKKNLALAVGVVSRLPFPVEFDVYGPIDDAEYWASVRKAMSVTPPHVRVTYKGELPHEKVPDVFARYHGFLFPTFGENFGHVIFEALAAGCPPIISDTTPWGDVAARNCGWVVPLDRPDQFGVALSELRRLNSPQLEAMRLRARCLASDYEARGDVVRAALGLFRAVCG